MPEHVTLAAPIILSLLLAGLPTARAQPRVEGTWQGEYTCAQGRTGLTLTVTPTKPAGKATAIGVKALFHFYATRSNPAVPEGCFEMRGTVDAVVGPVELSPTRWILQPPNYAMVGLAGTMRFGRAMTGTVSGPLCTTFKLERVLTSDDRVDVACHADAIASASIVH